MSLHIGAKENEIAETVLISGDPLRARHVAEKMLSDVFCYNEIRGMLGFTGMYKDKRVSVQGTGMGIPSTAIYVHELIHEYGVKKLIRIGTCGAIQPELAIGQLILAGAAYTDSNTQLKYFDSMEHASKANEELLEFAKRTGRENSIPFTEGIVFSTDIFYDDDDNRWDNWIKSGVLGVEMETSILYNLAAKYGVQALSVLSVSDNLITLKFAHHKEREQAGTDMMRLALEIA